MKKLVFTIQMVALMAMLPVYLVVELNHKAERLSLNNPPSEIIEKQQESNIQPVSNSGYEGLSSSVIKMNAYYLNQ
jgi:hypothetical protein